MSKLQDDLDVMRRALSRLASGSVFRSISHVARCEQLSDDKVIRAMSRATGLVGGQSLSETRNNRLVLTDVGRSFLEICERLAALGRASAGKAEVVKVAVSRGVPDEIVIQATSSFIREWVELVSVRVFVTTENISELVGTGQADVGLISGLVATPPSEELKPNLPLVALIPGGHRLAGCEGGELDRDHWAGSDHVFLSSHLRAVVDPLICRVTEVSRVYVEESNVLLGLVGGGWGVGFDYGRPFRREGESIIRVPIPNVTLSLGLILPRKGGTEPVNSFCAAVREAVRAMVVPPSALEVKPAATEEMADPATVSA